MTYEDLVNQIRTLNYYSDLYDKGESPISDVEWDRMYFALQAAENYMGVYLPDSPTQTVRYKVVNELSKVTHSHPMLSLDKTKSWEEFVGYFGNKSVVGMLKLDGLTCSLHYNNGVLVGAETRGNGTVGEDILHNALVIKNVPKRIDYSGELVIDGEVISTTINYDKFKEEYSNPRTFAAGSIRLLDSEECARRNLTFVAWNLVKGPCTTVVESFEFLNRLSFTVVPYTQELSEQARERLVESSVDYGYPIDGLVGRYNDIGYGEALGATGHHSRAAYAFKFYDETQTTYLLDIEFSMGRSGTLTPVAIFEPVDIDGAVVERASLHNLAIMKEVLSTPFRGQRIEVCRANMVIPQVVYGERPESRSDMEGLVIKVPVICPICGQTLSVEEDFLKCKNKECQGKLLNRLVHFCGKSGLDIKGLSEATIEKLIDWGWVSELADLYRLSDRRQEWIQKSGFGEKSVDNILEAIEFSRRPNLDSFISAIGIPLIGKSNSKDLVKYFNSYSDFRNSAKSKWDFTQIDGMGYERASSIWNFDFSEADAVDTYMFGYNVPEEKDVGESLAGKTFCITGRLERVKNRNELVSLIESHGGRVASSVSGNTDYLINNDVNSGSSKNASAKRLNIPIITENEFFEMFLTL